VPYTLLLLRMVSSKCDSWGPAAGATIRQSTFRKIIYRAVCTEARFEAIF